MRKQGWDWDRFVKDSKGGEIIVGIEYSKGAVVKELVTEYLSHTAV